jgi:CMP-2-keto-3-deoxyoctulosonic acid synthetase
MQREGRMTKKVMVEVGDLEKLKSAIESIEGLRFLEEEERILVELAKRVVAAEEKIQEALATPVDIDSY